MRGRLCRAACVIVLALSTIAIQPPPVSAHYNCQTGIQALLWISLYSSKVKGNIQISCDHTHYKYEAHVVLQKYLGGNWTNIADSGIVYSPCCDTKAWILYTPGYTCITNLGSKNYRAIGYIRSISAAGNFAHYFNGASTVKTFGCA